MRMPGAQIGLDAGGERGVGHPLVQLKQMRMAAPDAKPDDPGRAARGKSADALQRKKKSTETNGEEVGAQLFLRVGRDLTEKDEGEMQLFRAQPTHPGKRGVKPNDGVSDGRW